MSEEQAQNLLYQMQMLENYYNDIAQRESHLLQVLRETTSAIESLKSIKEKPESETLVPLGMGTYAKSKILSADKIVLNLGADVSMEKNNDDAINFLESRVKEIEVALNDATSKKQDVASRLEQGKQELNKMMQSSQSKK